MEQKVLSQIYEKYHRELYLYIFSLCRNHHAAEDLTQETLVDYIDTQPQS